MQVFVDNKNRKWTVEVTVGDVRRIRAELHIDLPKLFDDSCKGLGALLDDPVQIVDVLWLLCEAQANAVKVTPKEFGRAFAGDALERGADCLVEAAIDFFPNARTRTLTRAAMAKIRQGFTLLMDRADKVVQQMDPSTLSNSVSNSGQ